MGCDHNRNCGRANATTRHSHCGDRPMGGNNVYSYPCFLIKTVLDLQPERNPYALQSAPLRSIKPLNPARAPGHTVFQEKLMKKMFVHFAKNESGATAIEYGLIAAGISIAIVVLVGVIGTSLTATFQGVADNL
jgi:pilus assembly protein Flp/PilA